MRDFPLVISRICLNVTTVASIAVIASVPNQKCVAAQSYSVDYEWGEGHLDLRSTKVHGLLLI
jgi:hypothetical protein